MPSRLFPYAFLLSIGFISTIAIQDLRYYRDLIPDLSPEEIALKLERLLKVRNQNVPYGSLPFPHLDEFGVKEQRRREFERQSLQDAFSEKSNLIHVHPNKRVRQQHLSNYPSSRVAVEALQEEDPPSLKEYAGRNPREFYSYFHGNYDPSDIGPLADPKPQRLQNPEYNRPTATYRPHHQAARERGMKEEPLMEILSHGNSERSHYFGNQVNNDDREETVVDFTYRFDEPSGSIEEFKFARRPNEPGYDTPPEAPPSPRQTEVIGLKEDERPDPILPINEEPEDEESEDTVQNSEESVTRPDPLVVEKSTNEAEDQVHIGFERRADNHSPLVMAVDPKISNDIYFVAVVAGCSAAAMFILVLISLTWCRLQRGAKAAADVEYPAYGVTGPNRDTSPSGDRRLAQSAQMYHYQHQKQQIIAMESRTATARDPGSVSEAESDEDNEEGDYTVYECPGLAPTGEMEVKNPLFHDDPTPATPAAAAQGQKQSRSTEDHM